MILFVFTWLVGCSWRADIVGALQAERQTLNEETMSWLGTTSHGCLTRRVVAQNYFESTSDRAAVEKMNRWIKNDPYLRRALKKAGYRDRMRIFTPKIVRVFHQYFS